MNIDRNSIDRILAMDDDSLKRLALEIADAAGADRRRAEKLTANLDRVRAMISGMTPQEIEKLTSSIDREKSREIAEALRARGIDVGR